MLTVTDNGSNREIIIDQASINMNNAEEIRALIQKHILANMAVTLNLESLAYIDSCGLSMFIRLRQHCIDSGSTFALSHLQKNVILLLHATNLLEVLNAEVSTDELGGYLKEN